MKKKEVGKKASVLMIALLICTAIIPSISGVINPIEYSFEEKNLGQDVNDRSIKSNIDLWTMFHHDAQHTGYSSLKSSISSEPSQKWKFSTNGEVFSSCAIGINEGTALNAGIMIVAGSRDGKVYAVGADGTLIWSRTTLNPIDSSPMIANIDGLPGNEVVIGSSNGAIYVYDAATGSQKWSRSTLSAIDSSPVADDINNDGKTEIIVGSSDGAIYVYDAATGDQKWSRTTFGAITSSPATYDDNVYIGSTDDKIYCYNGDNGDELWNYITNGDVTSSPVISSGKLYIGSQDKKMYCLDAYTGNKLWDFTADSAIFSTAAVAEGVVFGSDDGTVYSLGKNGNKEWSYSTGGSIRSSPAIADIDNDGSNEIIIGSQDGKLYCIQDGTQEWAYTVGSDIDSSPCIGDIDSDGNAEIIFGSNDKNIYALGGGCPFPPKKPHKPIGPTEIKIGESAEYCTYTEDDSYTKVYYMFDWGDNSGESPTPQCDPATGACVSHSWSSKGTYNVRCKAVGVEPYYGCESEWSDPLIVEKTTFEYMELLNDFISYEKYFKLSSCVVHNNDTGKIYSSIQAAINDNDTKNGHTLFAESCTYMENIIITKSIQLIGESKTSTTIHGNNNGVVVTIVKPNVSISNIRIAYGGDGFYDAGIAIISSDNVTLRNLIFNDVHYGVWIEKSSSATISDNTFIGCSIGINIAVLPEEENILHYLHTIENNEVDGKLFQYLKNQHDAILSGNLAGVIVVNCTNIGIQTNVSSIDVGITIAYSHNVNYFGSMASNCTFGVRMIECLNGGITDCVISSNPWLGLLLRRCQGVHINFSDISDNNQAVIFEESSVCTFNDNTLYHNDEGLYLLRSSQISVISNLFVDNGLFIDGDELNHFYHNIPGDTSSVELRNKINGRDILYYSDKNRPFPSANAACVIFVNCNEGIIRGLNTNVGPVGFECVYSRDVIVENSAFSHQDQGIYVYHGVNEIYIQNCSFSSCGVGVFVRESSKVTLRDRNIFTDTMYAIRFIDSNYCTIENNNFYVNTIAAVDLYNSPDNQVTNNDFTENINSIRISYSSDDCVVENNAIEGKGWAFWQDGGAGIEIIGCKKVIVKQNEILRMGGEGIWLEDAMNTTVINNVIRFNWGNGIQLVSSHNNFIYDNYVNFNHWGIRLQGSNGNEIWGNTFWFNGILTENPGGGNAFDDGINKWNNIYGTWPDGILGGNCWSDWQIPDISHGPNQNEDGPDDVVDTPRLITGGDNIDRYPLIKKCVVYDDTSPECEIRFPEKGMLYVFGKPKLHLPGDLTIIIGNIDVIAYAEDHVDQGFASDHVQVEFWVDTTRKFIDSEPNDRFEYQWKAWDKRYLGLHTLMVRGLDNCGNDDNYDQMTVLIINLF